jgi:hypothetical protein
MLGEGVAAAAMPESLDCMRHGACNLNRTIAIMLHQVISHALRRFRAYTG